MVISSRKTTRYSCAKSHSDIHIRVSSYAISIHVEGHTFCRLDLEGRPVSIQRPEGIYWRGLDNRVVLLEWGGGPYLHRRRRHWLSEAECEVLFHTLHQTMQGVVRAAESGQVQVEIDDRADPLVRCVAREWVDRVRHWDPERLYAEQRRFARVYRPIAILPPDQYLAVVVQTVYGCPWNACSFCSFYKDRSFRIRTEDEVESHLSGIIEFLGAEMRMRKTVFLGDANALSMPQTQLLSTMERIRTRLPVLPEGLTPQERVEWRRSHLGALEGFYAFMDVFTGDHRSVSEFRELREHGMQRIYLGAEAGDNDLLRLLNKPATVEQLLTTVQRIKAGGLRVGVIFLLGVGGQRFAPRHEEAILRVCRKMPLQAGDIIYLSPLVLPSGNAYAEWLERHGIPIPTMEEMAEQERRLASVLRRYLPPDVRVAPYDIRGFIY